ncbi:MAG TPA: hypothetical protein VE733_07790 [Streptosporangiaceae bacterium]|nr:hypothetical protein [Streptosporangiaceae bacterium]
MDEDGRNRQQAREKITRMRAEEQRHRRRRTWLLGTGGLVVAAIAIVAITLAVTRTSSGRPGREAAGTPVLTHAPLTPRSSAAGTPVLNHASLGTLQPAGSAGRIGPEGVPVPAAAPLAGTAAAASGQPVDGIRCQPDEMSVFHIHAHLTIFVNGSPRQIPAGIGIPGAQVQNTAKGLYVSSGRCYYWPHTHAADGIIHIESPVPHSFTLGEFFDEWGQPLGPGKVGPATGPVVAFYNGQRYEGNPRNIPLSAFAQIQLEVGTPLIAPESISFPGNL